MATEVETRTDSLETRVRLDEALLALAAEDLTAALTTQNRRFSSAWDPLRLSRDPVREQRLVFWGVFLSCLATGLSFILILLELAANRPIGLAVALGLLGLVLAGIFTQLPRIRLATLGWTARLLSRRVSRFMRPLLEQSPFEIHYRLEGRRLGSRWERDGEVLRERTHELSGYRLCELGARCGALFRSPRSLRPALVFFYGNPEQRRQWQKALGTAGVESVETLPRRI